ncbi:MAG: CDP-2,3-bis-(O-geranylgeranyl)-sn-glycerol synthase [Candidatus Hadarchaeum sp.]
MTSFFNLIEQAIWFILPAYFANAAPVILGGGPPLDLGRRFVDGRRIFGEGKTLYGFLSGLVAGTLIGLLQRRALVGLMLALGALMGDLIGSFIKRRLGMAQGKMAPGLDQLGFAVVAIAMASPIELPSWPVIATILILTPPIHLATNFLGYKLGLKTKPY